MKKILAVLSAIVVLLTLAACGGGNGAAKSIYLVTREEGSGTRDAFVSLFNVKDENGADSILETAETLKDTAVMLLTVTGDPDAIGYISLGSLNGSVKALRIDGAAPGVETIRDGSYKISRPFNLVTKGELSAPAQDFLDYILSAEGQAVVEGFGCMPLEAAEPYEGAEVSGKVTVTGSSSVGPLMEKLIEAYEALGKDVTFDFQQIDSATGINNTIEGVCDIGMASRDLKDSEIEAGVAATMIATDGIAVIVNNANALEALTAEQVRAIFTGEITVWDELEQ